MKLSEPGEYNCGVGILHGFTGPITEEDVKYYLTKSAILAILNADQRKEYHDTLTTVGFRVVTVFPNWVHNGTLLTLYIYEALPDRSVDNPRFNAERYPTILAAKEALLGKQIPVRISHSSNREKAGG